MNKISKISFWCFNHYFHLLCLNALVYLVVPKAAVFLYIILPIVSFSVGSVAKRKRRVRNNHNEIILYLIVIWCFITWVFNRYDNQLILIVRCLLSQLAFMMFYYVGCNDKLNIYLFIEKSKKVFICVAIIGIIWFVRPPSWMLDKIILDENFNGYNLQEFLRLKSIFFSPYEITYRGSILGMYLLDQIFRYNAKSGLNLITLFFVVIVLLLGMMRAPALSFLGTVCVYLLLFWNKLQSKTKRTITIITVITVIFLFIGLSYVGVDNMDYIISKINSLSNAQDLVNGRIDLGFSYDLIGDGAGRHAVYVDKYGQQSLRDSEYIKILVEQGYVGISLMIVLLAMAFYKVLKNIRRLTMEFCVLVFYTIAMIGANPLTTQDKHCFIFWLIIGRIFAYRKHGKCKSNNCNSNIQCVQNLAEGIG